MTFTSRPFSKLFIPASILCSILFAFGFTSTQASYIGTFGVASDDPSEITLIIKKDGTFSFLDFSIPSNKIKVKGTWILKNKHIILKSAETLKFHNHWKFNAAGTIAKSRKGISFYTLNRKS